MTSVMIPNLGEVDNVSVIEINISPKSIVTEGDTLVVLESDKASIDIPAPLSGTVEKIYLIEGVNVKEGDLVCDLLPSNIASDQTNKSAGCDGVASTSEKEKHSELQKSTSLLVHVPDYGSDEPVSIVEIPIALGDLVEEGETLIVLESDKASIEIPAPKDGRIEAIRVQEEQQVSQSDILVVLNVEKTDLDKPGPQEMAVAESESNCEKEDLLKVNFPSINEGIDSQFSNEDIHAGPAVRLLARDLGVDLRRVNPSGPKRRILKDDLHEFVRLSMKNDSDRYQNATTGIPDIPKIDFSTFGKIEKVPMTRIQQITAQNMTRYLLDVPTVTQFADVDITELENFRKLQNAGNKDDIKLTALAFIVLGCVHALKKFPYVNASLDVKNKEIILKSYINIGIAVNTHHGLMVPVIKNADRKGLRQIAEECLSLSQKAREKQLLPKELQGASFTISNLGSVGVSSFTPIVPSPEVAILGVSRATIQPVWNGKSFDPRLILPLSVSYDHRIINGTDGACFAEYLSSLLTDIRQILL